MMVNEKRYTVKLNNKLHNTVSIHIKPHKRNRNESIRKNREDKNYSYFD